jgi:septal ring factor EnvC (AmiA/AmiB activator)
MPIELIKKITLVWLSFLIVAASSGVALGQTAGDADTGDCTTKESCQSLLDKYESLLAQFDTNIKKTSGEKQTLQNQIAALKKKTDALTIQIKQSNAMIGDLKIQISDTRDSVQNTNNQIADSQKHLTTIIRAINETDQTPVVESLLSEAKLSDFFDNLVYLENLNNKSNQVLQDIKGLKQSLQDQQSGLENEEGDLEKTTEMQTLQKQQHEQTQAEYNKTLQTKNAQIKQTTQAKQLTAQVIAKIKQRMFALAGVSGLRNGQERGQPHWCPPSLSLGNIDAGIESWEECGAVLSDKFNNGRWD